MLAWLHHILSHSSQVKAICQEQVDFGEKVSAECSRVVQEASPYLVCVVGVPLIKPETKPHPKHIYRVSSQQGFIL